MLRDPSSLALNFGVVVIFFCGVGEIDARIAKPRESERLVSWRSDEQVAQRKSEKQNWLN